MTSAQPTAINGREPGGNPATWLPGVMLADAVDERPDAAVRDSIPAEAWTALRRFGRRYGLPVTADTMFEQLDAIPAAVAECCGLGFTWREVAEFVADYAYPLPDPNDVGAQLDAERAKRFRDRDRADRALKAERVAPACPYTVDEVRRVCGDQVAANAGALVDRTNLRAWAAPKPHDHRERTNLVSANELHAELGVPAADVAAMTPATAAERDAALTWLAVARKRHLDGVTRKAKAVDRPTAPVADRMMSFAELATLAPPTALIDGLVFAGESSELIGPPGGYKSFTAVTMALSIATGRPFGTRHHVPGGAAPVVYVAGEGLAGMHSRVAAWCHHRGVDPVKLDGTFHAHRGPVHLGDPDDMAGLTDFVGTVGAKLVVFDTRARCTVGMEENSATDQGIAIGAVDRLIADTGAATLMVHHTALASPDRGRGSSAWFGAVYSSLVQSVNSDGRVVIRCAKHKDARDGCEHAFAIEPVSVPDGPASLVLADFDPLSAPASGRGTNVPAEILALIRETSGPDGLTAPMIIDAATERKVCQKTATRSAIKVLFQSGELTNVGTDGRPRYAAADPVTP